MKVWIDFSNSPHPLLFAPVVARLEELGHSVELTARDNAQTLELARARWPHVVPFGGPSPGELRAKVIALTQRVRALQRFARASAPDVALSHNSYAQIVAARTVGIPVVTAMDFEHQPANHLAFRLAHAILVPSPLRVSALRRQGATRRKVRTYPGLKEELYLGDFEPDRGILASLGIGPDNGKALVVARTPPEGATYHQFSNSVFAEALEAVGRHDDVRCVVLARHAAQREALADLDLPNLVVPRRAVDSRSLLYQADLVLGSGGTMTREAALLGVPTYSLFAGRTPAVDRWLEERGLLRPLRDLDGLARIERRRQPTRSLDDLRARSERIVESFIETILETVG